MQDKAVNSPSMELIYPIDLNHTKIKSTQIKDLCHYLYTFNNHF